MERRKTLFVVVLLFVFISIGSYVAFGSFRQVGGETSSQTLSLENYANQLSVENSKFTIMDVDYLSEENLVQLYLQGPENVSFEVAESEEEGKGTGWNIFSIKGEKAAAPRETASLESSTSTTKVPREAYETAKETSESVLVLKQIEKEGGTHPYWLYSISIGALISAIIAAVLLSQPEVRGNATGRLLEEGLENLTIRDAEIFSHIMKMDEFTIPQLMKRTSTSKVTTWRTVKKLEDEGLVRETNRTRAPSRGLGGRGKPSKVYEYIAGED